MSELLTVAILAGGLATRLHPLTHALPKSLIPIRDEPFIAHQLRLLRSAGIQRVVLCLGHLGSQIKAYVQDGRAFDLTVAYSFDNASEGGHLLGTAGCLKKALPLLGKTFFVCYGDSYLSCDYRAIQQAYFTAGKKALMTIYHNQNQWDTSNVEYQAGQLIDYNKTPTPRMQYIDYGLGVWDADFLDAAAGSLPGDLAAVYQHALREQQLATYEVAERFYEIGSQAGIAAFEQHVSQKN